MIDWSTLIAAMVVFVRRHLREALVVVGIALFLFAVVWWRCLDVGVAISSPADGAHVAQRVDIEGTAKNLLGCPWLGRIFSLLGGPDTTKDGGRRLWLLIYSYTASKYFPINKPTDIRPNGRWKEAAVVVGTSRDKGKYFDVIAGLADLRFQAAVARAMAKSAYRGFKTLPDGSYLQYDKITVIRQ